MKRYIDIFYKTQSERLDSKSYLKILTTNYTFEEMFNELVKKSALIIIDKDNKRIINNYEEFSFLIQHKLIDSNLANKIIFIVNNWLKLK